MNFVRRWPLICKLSQKQYEVIAYIVVGGWNTIFGMGIFALAYQLFGDTVHYLLLAIPVNILAISNAFLCYKLFVFQTKGNWFVEYIRCFIVYGGGTLVSMLLLWLLTECSGMSPVISNCLATTIVVIGSFFGHKYFSFKRKKCNA